MIRAWRLRWAAERQFANVRRVLDGGSAASPTFGTTTLDRDDVQIARRWLRDRRRWDKPETVQQYERQFAVWNGSRHAFAFMGGRVALGAALHCMDLGDGDEIIVPGYTCVVVANAVKHAGAKVVYCDIELDTYGADVRSVEQAISPRTRAIVIQHLYGLVCRDYEALLALAERSGIVVVEDCAHATGAEFKGRKVGTRGKVGFYSSEQSKPMNTIQGGVVVTDDDRLAARLKEFQRNAPFPNADFVEALLYNVILQYYERKHPQRWLLGDLAEILYGDYRLVSTSNEELRGQKPAHYGCRMPAPIAALGINQLRKLDRYNTLRRSTAKRWDGWCKEHGYKPATVVPDSVPIFLRYPVIVEPARKLDRSWGKSELQVEVGEWFKGSLHPLSGAHPGCPQASMAVEQCINFPCLMG